MEVPTDDEFDELFQGSTKTAPRMTKESLEEALNSASKLRTSFYQDKDNHLFVELTQRYEDMDDAHLLLGHLQTSKRHKPLTAQDVMEYEAFIRIVLSNPDHDDHANNRFLQFSYGRFRTINGQLKGQCGFGYDPKQMIADNKAVFQAPHLLEEGTPIYITVPASISPQLIDQKVKESLQSKATVTIIGTVREGGVITIPFETIGDLRRLVTIVNGSKAYRPLQEKEATDGKGYIQTRTTMLPEDRDYGTIELRRGQFTTNRTGLLDMEGKPITPKQVADSNRQAQANPEKLFNTPLFLNCYET